MLLDDVSLIDDLHLESLEILEYADSVFLVVLFGHDQDFGDFHSGFNLDGFHVVRAEGGSQLEEVIGYLLGLNTLGQQLFGDNLDLHGFGHFHLLQLGAEHLFNLLDGDDSGFDVDGGLSFVSKFEDAVDEKDRVLTWGEGDDINDLSLSGVESFGGEHLSEDLLETFLLG